MSLMEAVDDLLQYLRPSERRELDEHLSVLRPRRKGAPAPKQWRDRARLMFPKYVTHPFAPRHAEMWEWAAGIELESAPDPFIGVWPREGGKSTSAEMLVADLGMRGKRRYCLYVRGNQEKANDSVSNIGGMLEAQTVVKHFPDHADRAVNKFGSARGWRRERLHTKGGFVVDALGLDTLARGAKVDEQRPDIIVFDDIDELGDSPAVTLKKRNIITHTIIPAGSRNCAILGIQNLIIPDGIFSQLADNRADFLVDRTVSGPFPALIDFKYEWRMDERTGRRRAVITAGVPTWEGQSVADCQRFINTWGLQSFQKECQHRVKERSEGVALRFDPKRHYIDLSDDQVREAVKSCRVFGGVDFGAWRFGFTLWIMDRHRTVVRFDEYFSQPETVAERKAREESAAEGEVVEPMNSLTVRAMNMHAMCVYYGIDGMIPIWGDAANPQDILELNQAFVRGWMDPETNKKVKPRLRVVPVKGENKARVVAVERINNALDHNALRFRRSVGTDHTWRLGMNAASEGTLQTKSRLMWEIENWSFPIPKAGEPQDQNPDDDTADGSDMIAASRYALMSHWTAAGVPKDYGVVEHDRAEAFDYKKKGFKEAPHAADDIMHAAPRRSPRVRVPRPRFGRRK